MDGERSWTVGNGHGRLETVMDFWERSWTVENGTVGNGTVMVTRQKRTKHCSKVR